MLKYVIIILAVLLVVISVFFIFMSKGPSLSDVAYMKTPQINKKANQKVLLVKAVGAPEAIVGKSLKLLFKTFYKLKGVPKNPMPAPRARWFVDSSTPQDKWEGHFAIPVPDNVSEIPVIKDDSGLKVELVTWEYGEVVEILHVGSYETEMPTIDYLKNFITQNHYEIAGPHEEEYLKGPSPFFPTNPKKYLTIIRYQVKRSI